MYYFIPIKKRKKKKKEKCDPVGIGSNSWKMEELNINTVAIRFL